MTHRFYTLKLLLLPLLLLCGGQAQGQAVATPTLATLPDVAAALHARAALPMAASANSEYAASLSNGTDTGANVRSVETAPIGGMTDFSIVFCNQGTTPYTVTTALEYPLGTAIPAFFAGQRSITIPAGGQASTDPVGVYIPGGATYYVRDYVSVTAGNTWPRSAAYGSAPNDGYLHGTSQTDQTITPGFSFSGTIYEFGFCHNGIIARLASGSVSGIILGDSIAHGQGDAAGGAGYGYIDRALFAAHIGRTKVAAPGETTAALLVASGLPRLMFAKYATFAIDEYGVNDITQGHSLAQMQADKITLWQQMWFRNLKVWCCTITPETTSTDSFATAANQTARSGFAATSIRSSYNDWLRAGAPVASASSIVAVAPGTAGSVPCPYLTGYFEAADIVETSRNSGIWKGRPASVTGTVTATSNISGYTQSVTDTGQMWTAAQLVGSAITVTSGVNNGRSGYLIWTAPGTFTVGSMYNFAIGDTYTLSYTVMTLDGVHPSSSAHALLSAAINTAKIKL